MTAFDFASAGFFSTDSLTRKELKAIDADGNVQTGDVWVKTLPAIELRRFQEETASDDQKVREQAGFRALVLAIRNEDGTPMLTNESVRKLTGSGISALMEVFSDVHKRKDHGELGNG